MRYKGKYRMKLKNKLKLAVFFISMLLITCCGGGGETKPPPVTPPVTPPITPPVAPPVAVRPLGTWISPCNESWLRVGAVTFGRQVTQTYNADNTFERKDELYVQLNGTSAACIKSKHAQTTTITGNYKLGSIQNGVTQIDRENIKVKAIVTGNVATNVLNSLLVIYNFGYEDRPRNFPWKSNVSRVVTYTRGAKKLYYPGVVNVTPSAVSPSLPADPPAPITALDIFKITKTGDATKINWGNKENLDANPTNKRPLTLDNTPANTGTFTDILTGTWETPFTRNFFGVHNDSISFDTDKQLTQTYKNNSDFTWVEKLYFPPHPGNGPLSLLETVTVTGKYKLGSELNGHTNIKFENIKITAVIRHSSITRITNSLDWNWDYTFGYNKTNQPWATNITRVVTYTRDAKKLYYPGVVSVTPPSRSPALPANPPSPITALNIFKVTTVAGTVKLLQLGDYAHLDGSQVNKRPFMIDNRSENASTKLIN